MTTRSKLATRIIEKLNRLPQDRAEKIRRCYEKSLWIAYLAAGGLVTPTGDARPRLLDLEHAIGNELAAVEFAKGALFVVVD